MQEKQNLIDLELSCCAISDGIGDHIRDFFVVNQSLKSLELKFNNLNVDACNGIGKGILNFKGFLKYLGLAGNPVMEAGFLAIGAGCKDTSQIQKLDVMSCNLGENGGFRVCKNIFSIISNINSMNLY